MWPGDIKQLSPEQQRELSQEAVETLKRLGASRAKVAILPYLMIVGFLLILLHSGHDPLLRSLLFVLVVVVAVAFFLRNLAHSTFDPRSISIQNELPGGLENSDSAQVSAAPSSTSDGNPKPSLQPWNLDKLVAESGLAPSEIHGDIQTAGLAGLHRVKDLSELQPELAASPDVQKLFELAKGGDLWMTSLGQNQKIVGPVQTSIRIISGIKGRAESQTLSSLGELPPELAASPDIQKLFETLRGRAVRMSNLQPEDRAPCTRTGNDNTARHPNSGLDILDSALRDTGGRACGLMVTGSRAIGEIEHIS